MYLIRNLNLLFVCLLVLFCQPVSAATPPDSFKGLALIHLKSRRLSDQIYEQAVIVKGKEAQFVGLSNLGTVAFVLTFQNDEMILQSPAGGYVGKNKKLRKLLSLPLTKEEFLAVIRYEKPQDFHFKETSTRDKVSWIKPKRQKMKIEFSNFMEDKSYPKQIRIEYKHSFFDLKWQNLSFEK